MALTLLPMVRFLRLEQPMNACSSSTSVLLGMTTVVSIVHPLKALNPIERTLLPIVTDDNSTLFWKA